MTQDYKHPVAPPPDLVQQWMEEFHDPQRAHWEEYEAGIATRAAQWGYEQHEKELLDAMHSVVPQPYESEDL